MAVHLTHHLDSCELDKLSVTANLFGPLMVKIRKMRWCIELGEAQCGSIAFFR